MEYVLVVYPTDRRVFVNGEPCGRTNKSFRVNSGEHSFDLGNPQNYAPQAQAVLVENTTAIEPLEIVFERKDC